MIIITIVIIIITITISKVQSNLTITISIKDQILDKNKVCIDLCNIFVTINNNCLVKILTNKCLIDKQQINCQKVSSVIQIKNLWFQYCNELYQCFQCWNCSTRTHRCILHKMKNNQKTLFSLLCCRTCVCSVWVCVCTFCLLFSACAILTFNTHWHLDQLESI